MSNATILEIIERALSQIQDSSRATASDETILAAEVVACYRSVGIGEITLGIVWDRFLADETVNPDTARDEAEIQWDVAHSEIKEALEKFNA